MSAKPDPGSKDWIKGGRAYGLAKLAMLAILVAWGTIVALVVADKYTEALNNLFLLTIGAIGTLGGAQQLPNIAESWKAPGGGDA